MKDRAIRRHHNERIKNNRKNYWFGKLTPRMLGMAAKTPKPCSCMMCCNPRLYEGDSLKERSQKENDSVELYL